MEGNKPQTMTKTQQVLSLIGLVIFFILVGFAASSCDPLAFTKF